MVSSATAEACQWVALRMIGGSLSVERNSLRVGSHHLSVVQQRVELVPVDVLHVDLESAEHVQLGHQALK